MNKTADEKKKKEKNGNSRAFCFARKRNKLNLADSPLQSIFPFYLTNMVFDFSKVFLKERWHNISIGQSGKKKFCNK